MASAHTPGPWVQNSANAEEIIAPDDVQVIARIPGAKTGLYNRAAPANARLIAAAPDLLEALRAAEDWLDGWVSAEPQLAMIRAAIAKAEGRS